ncbi:MAG: cytochrome c peroxidase [Bacteroidota bacterium]
MNNHYLTILVSFVLFSLLTSCVKDEAESPIDVTLERTLLRLSENNTLTDYMLPDGSNLSAIPAGVGNELTPEKVKLGQLLFYETGIARDASQTKMIGTYSCSTCHVPESAFTAGAAQGIADGAVGFGINGLGREMDVDYEEDEIDAQGARPLSMLGVAYVTNSMWAGRFGAHDNNEATEAVWGVHDPATEVNHLGLDGLEAQNIEGTITHRMDIDDYVLDTLGYRFYFDAAFGDWPRSARYGRVAMSFALSAYLRTLLPNEAPWQNWLRGDRDALTDQEKEGALLFFGKAGCYRCHNGPALNSNTFHALGVNDLSDIGGLKTSDDDTRNLGRGDFTRNPADMYRFKVPQVYNTKDMPFYFHGSSKQSLRELVDYFNAGVPENPRVPVANISNFFHPLNLNETEINQLVAFLSEGLYDDNLNRYVPDGVLSGNCMPNNDPLSRADLGCE